ncbi:hypothetical protein, partial [Limnoraphis robusta]
MINFKLLDLQVNEKYSFVGIQKEGENLVFHLPKGFDYNDPSLKNLDTFDQKRDLFFLFYRLFRRFKEICLEREVFSNRLNDRDGTFTDNRGADNFTDSEGNENIFYSKIDVLDKLLDLYDELKILSMVSRLGKSKDIDYSQIHRFLHNGIFLENNAVYIDHVSLPRSEVHYDQSDII